eukprot:2142458-Ditylum_brightwellii.AAC.1
MARTPRSNFWPNCNRLTTQVAAVFCSSSTNHQPLLSQCAILQCITQHGNGQIAIEFHDATSPLPKPAFDTAKTAATADLITAFFLHQKETSL